MKQEHLYRPETYTMTRDGKKKKSKEDGITENHQDGSWEASQEIHERKKKEAEAQDGI